MFPLLYAIPGMTMDAVLEMTRPELNAWTEELRQQKRAEAAAIKKAREGG